MREICCGYAKVQSFCTFRTHVFCGGEIDMRPVNWGAKTVENTDVSGVHWHRAQSQEMSWAPRILAVLNQRQISEKNVVRLPFASSVAQVLWASTKMCSSAMGWRETLMTVFVCECVGVPLCYQHCKDSHVVNRLCLSGACPVHVSSFLPFSPHVVLEEY